MRTYFLNGAWNCTCDVCGLRFKSVDIVRRWDGAMTCKSCYEPRHPQDFIRVRDERISVPFSRPENDLFVPQNTSVSVTDSLTLSEQFVSVATYLRSIPSSFVFYEPLTPASHALGLLKLNEETFGGTGRNSDISKETIVITESITVQLNSIASNRVLNGSKLNEVTLG